MIATILVVKAQLKLSINTNVRLKKWFSEHNKQTQYVHHL